MSKSVKFLALATLAMAAFIGGRVSISHDHDREAVSSFNAGFSDAKRDDCEQGYAFACAWLDSAALNG